MPFVSTAEAARLLGVSPSTVKRWSDEGRLRCLRTAGKHRRFDRADVERFQAELHDSPLTDFSASRWVKRLVEEQDVYRVQAALLEERARLGSWWGVADALGSVLTEIGERWTHDELTVAQEHLASDRLRRAILACAAGQPARSNAPRCLLAAIQDDQHNLGLALVELCAREAGWACDSLGPHLPTDDLIRHLETESFDLLAVSASAWSGNAETLRRHFERIAATCRRCSIELVVGGSGAWPEDPDYGHRLSSFAALNALLADLSVAKATH
jgi:excisionase family DNA binding protein